jgi:hypothetical protein
MTVQAIATRANPFDQLAVMLEGTAYNLAFAWNMRSSTWYLSIADGAQVDIYNGIKLIVGYPLLRMCADPRRPPGELFVVDSTGANTPPGLYDLLPGGRCTLVYMTSDVLTLAMAGDIAEYLATLATNTQTGTQSTYGQQ